MNPQNINRKGRPKKGQTLTDILNQRLQEPVSCGDADSGKESQKIAKEVIIDKIIEIAVSGNLNAIRYIFDRIDGLPTVRVEQKTTLPQKIELITQYEAER